MTIRAKIALGYFAALTALLLVMATFRSTSRAMAESQRAIVHTLQVIDWLDDELGAALDEQDAVRGYALTGDERELAAIQAARSRSDTLLGELHALVADSDQAARLESLGNAIQRLLDDGEQLVAIRRTQGLDAAIAHLHGGRGRARMDEVRRIEEEMDDAESRLLAERTQRAQDTVSAGLRNSALASAAAIALVLAAFALTNRSIAKPIADMEAAARRIGAGDLGYRIHPSGNDELTSLARHLDDMAERRQEAVAKAEHVLASLKREKGRLSFLADVGTRLARSLDLESTLQNICEAAVPTLADACMVHLLEDDGAIRRAATFSDQARLARVLEEIRTRFPVRRNDQLSVVARALRTGAPQLLARVPPNWPEEYAQNAEHLELLRKLDMRSVLSVPIPSPQRTIGALTLLSTTPGHFSEEDVWLAQEMGTRASLAIQNARLYRDSVAATRARDHVLAVVSHDLKNPLNAVGLAAAALRRKAPATSYGESVGRNAAFVLRGTRRMEQLIQRLVDAAKLESGTLKLNFAPADPAALVREAVEEIEPVALDHGLAIDVSLPTAPLVVCDRERVLQVFSNLLGNAVRFTPRGGTLKVHAAEKGGFVEFEVADTGAGISPEALPHVFERYWQAPGVAGGGSGLGLFIAKEIVQAHGGVIRAESELGHGARLIFTLPTASRTDGEAASLSV